MFNSTSAIAYGGIRFEDRFDRGLRQKLFLLPPTSILQPPPAKRSLLSYFLTP